MFNQDSNTRQARPFATRPFNQVDLKTEVEQLRQLIDSINNQFLNRTNALAAKTDGFFGFAADGSEALKPGM